VRKKGTVGDDERFEMVRERRSFVGNVRIWRKSGRRERFWGSRDVKRCSVPCRFNILDLEGSEVRRTIEEVENRGISEMLRVDFEVPESLTIYEVSESFTSLEVEEPGSTWRSSETEGFDGEKERSELLDLRGIDAGRYCMGLVRRNRR
jgi:hypothetical protein